MSNDDVKDPELVREFNRRMQYIAEHDHEIGLDSKTFKRMMRDRGGEIGGYQTALALLRDNPPENTLTYCKQMNRLDLCVERYVVDPKFEALFTLTQREIAQARLDYQYT